MSIEAKLAEATIKVERLRKALTEMVDRFESADDDPPYVVRARAALRGGGESPQPEPEQPATSKHNPAWRALGVGQPPSEEHSKHPTGDYCVYCLSQWPCEESGVE